MYVYYQDYDITVYIKHILGAKLYINIMQTPMFKNACLKAHRHIQLICLCHDIYFCIHIMKVYHSSIVNYITSWMQCHEVRFGVFFVWEGCSVLIDF